MNTKNNPTQETPGFVPADSYFEMMLKYVPQEFKIRYALQFENRNRFVIPILLFFFYANVKFPKGRIASGDYAGKTIEYFFLKTREGFGLCLFENLDRKSVGLWFEGDSEVIRKFVSSDSQYRSSSSKELLTINESFDLKESRVLFSSSEVKNSNCLAMFSEFLHSRMILMQNCSQNN